MIETTQKLKMADFQIEGYKRSIQHSKLTSQEITALPDAVRTFEGVGRMYVYQSSLIQIVKTRMVHIEY